jgi:hypothetical protein
MALANGSLAPLLVAHRTPPYKHKPFQTFALEVNMVKTQDYFATAK